MYSRRDLDGRDFLPQFTHKGKTWLVMKKAKETKIEAFQKNEVRVMTDVRASETIQLSSIREIPQNVDSYRSSCIECMAYTWKAGSDTQPFFI